MPVQLRPVAAGASGLPWNAPCVAWLGRTADWRTNCRRTPQRRMSNSMCDPEEVPSLGSLDLDDDLALRAACLDVGDGFVGGLERENLVDNRTDGARFDETGDLPKLAPVRLHEEE